MMHGTTNIKFT